MAVLQMPSRCQQCLVLLSLTSHSCCIFILLPTPGLAQDADVLVHEATNTFLPGVDKDGNMRLVTRDAKIHGHSTPFMVSENVCLIDMRGL